MDNSLSDAVTVATVASTDFATVRLARTYAALIDEAAPRATYARHLAVLRASLGVGTSPAAYVALDAVESALAAHSVASDLGPKLLATLAALGLTVASRRGGTEPQHGPASPSALDELRSQRAKRAQGAG